MSESLSIHPRNWPKTGNKTKKNTSKPPKPPSKKLDRKLAWLNVRQKERDQTLRVGRNVNPGAFKMPGSMND